MDAASLAVGSHWQRASGRRAAVSVGQIMARKVNGAAASGGKSLDAHEGPGVDPLRPPAWRPSALRRDVPELEAGPLRIAVAVHHAHEARLETIAFLERNLEVDRLARRDAVAIWIAGNLEHEDPDLLARRGRPAGRRRMNASGILPKSDAEFRRPRSFVLEGGLMFSPVCSCQRRRNTPTPPPRGSRTPCPPRPRSARSASGGILPMTYSAKRLRQIRMYWMPPRSMPHDVEHALESGTVVPDRVPPELLDIAAVLRPHRSYRPSASAPIGRLPW